MGGAYPPRREKKMYSNEEIRHHFRWMLDNTDINPCAITNAWELWERHIYFGQCSANADASRWIDYILKDEGITPDWK